jgi:xanthine dehydrogenase accessory factor
VRPDVLELAADLSRAGRPFALATVVWRRAPSSGKEGATALVTADGKVRGWLGGACAEPTVVREALRALEEGTPRLLFLGVPEELEAHRRDGVVTVPIACQSEGALEVYVEPVLPSPKVVAIGRSPAATTLVKLAAALGWRTALVDDGAEASDHPELDEVATSLDRLPEMTDDDRTYVVVATQGHYDEDALQAALATPAAYVGLIASARRAEAILGYLRDRGVSDAAIARVHAPAGLDLGHVTTEEIAVAVLADLVRARAAGELAGGVEAAPAERHEAIDPVCGMTVDVAGARYRATHEGRTYYFCSAGCLEQFERSPATFLPAPAG